MISCGSISSRRVGRTGPQARCSVQQRPCALVTQGRAAAASAAGWGCKARNEGMLTMRKGFFWGGRGGERQQMTMWVGLQGRSR